MSSDYFTGPVRTIEFKTEEVWHGLSVTALIDGKPIMDVLHEFEREMNAKPIKEIARLNWNPKGLKSSGDLPFSALDVHSRLTTVADLPLRDRKFAMVLSCDPEVYLPNGHTTVDIKITASHLHWLNVRSHLSKNEPYPEFGYLTFDRKQYQEACDSLHARIFEYVCSLMSERFKKIEEQHLQHEVRSDRAKLESLLHDSFLEIGASGKVYTRAEVLEALEDEVSEIRVVENFRVRPVNSKDPTQKIYQTFYLLRHESSEGEIWTQRTSIWQQIDREWKLMFHQGTPVA